MPTSSPVYPVALVVAGKRCLVVGGGPIAARKAAGLRGCGADVHVVARSVGDEMRALGVHVDERDYRRGDVAGNWLVVTATGDPAVDGAVFADAQAAGVWCNSADDPQRCSFLLPAVARQGPVAIAVSTGGHSPALAAWLRDQLAEHVGPEHAVLAGLLADARTALQESGTPTEGLDWKHALDAGLLDLIRAGHVAQARERLQACLSSS